MRVTVRAFELSLRLGPNRWRAVDPTDGDGAWHGVRPKAGRGAREHLVPIPTRARASD